MTFFGRMPTGIVQDYIASVTLVNNTAKTIDVEVPANEVWELESIKFTNPDNVDRSVNVRLFKEAAKTNELAFLFSHNVPTGDYGHFPGTASYNILGQIGYPKRLEGGNTLEIYWAAGGASAGATDADGLAVTYKRMWI